RVDGSALAPGLDDAQTEQEPRDIADLRVRVDADVRQRFHHNDVVAISEWHPRRCAIPGVDLTHDDVVSVAPDEYDAHGCTSALERHVRQPGGGLSGRHIAAWWND